MYSAKITLSEARYTHNGNLNPRKTPGFHKSAKFYTRENIYVFSIKRPFLTYVYSVGVGGCPKWPPPMATCTAFSEIDYCVDTRAENNTHYGQVLEIC